MKSRTSSSSSSDSYVSGVSSIATGASLANGGNTAVNTLGEHLKLLRFGPSQPETNEISTAPIFSEIVRRHAESALTQYGMFAGMADRLSKAPVNLKATISSPGLLDPRIFFNVAAPSSTFICGSQGSGKSHTLACLLENCLTPSSVCSLRKPVAGLVFHYDTFVSDAAGSPCEAAFLSSHPNIKVRVLCSPTNFRTIQGIYGKLNVQIEPLRISQKDLTTKRMLDLMAVNQDEGMPLYLHAIIRILRDMRIIQQESKGSFNYAEFKRLVMSEALTGAQLGPMKMRFDTLESFMPKEERDISAIVTSEGKVERKGRTNLKAIDWALRPGCLTIVDLSCPCINPETACSLFNICLSIFLEQGMDTGRIVALDEAHKFMNSSPEALTLTNNLISTIRLQRHLGTRIIISTQEPTISPTLLDLCSITIVHRFSSPDWLRTLQKHIAAATPSPDEKESPGSDNDSAGGSTGSSNSSTTVLRDIVSLGVGEALLFAPGAMMKVENDENGKTIIRRMGSDYLKIRVRARLTTDGGMSVMAS